MNRKEHLSFRPQFLPSLIFYGTIGLLILLVSQLGNVLLIPSLISLVVMVAVIYGFTLLHTVRVSKEGISALDMWDLRHFVKWEDVASVKPIQLGNLRFLRLYYGQRKSLWLPLFLVKQEQFEKWISTNLPKKHSLNNYFVIPDKR